MWGEALEILRKDSGLSKRDLPREGMMEREQYMRICKSRYGPSVAVLDRLLAGFHASWAEWAKAVETAKATQMYKSSSRTSAVKRPIKAHRKVSGLR